MMFKCKIFKIFYNRRTKIWKLIIIFVKSWILQVQPATKELTSFKLFIKIQYYNRSVGKLQQDNVSGVSNCLESSGRAGLLYIQKKSCDQAGRRNTRPLLTKCLKIMLQSLSARELYWKRADAQVELINLTTVLHWLHAWRNVTDIFICCHITITYIKKILKAHFTQQNEQVWSAKCEGKYYHKHE